jgi:hypothetical protein
MTGRYIPGQPDEIHEVLKFTALVSIYLFDRWILPDPTSRRFRLILLIHVAFASTCLGYAFVQRTAAIRNEAVAREAQIQAEENEKIAREQELAALRAREMAQQAEAKCLEALRQQMK